jgi:serine/threonine protein kinase/Tfp pilus assembly protein PilF
MNPERPSAYEQLSPEAAARVDAVCDDFEKAWKAAQSGATMPQLSNFLNGCDEHERTILAEELQVLDRACRERYGYAIRPGDSNELGPANLAQTALDHQPGRRTGVAAGRPSIPGLELIEVLGSGGMGVVFKGKQAKLDRDVAVKFLHDAHRADSEHRERFLQEARAVARLRHPHLVQVYEFGEASAAGGAASQPYLVLEYVSGGSLADLLRRSPQPPREAARLVEMLADAIHYAHQQGVIHRDLKPANVLLAGSRESAMGTGDSSSDTWNSRLQTTHSLLPIPKITDFGLAKFSAGAGLTQTGDVLGTPSYMAPEQTVGKSDVITTAVDVYGLGAILYEALTGRPPFQAETAIATVAQVRQDEPVSPRRLQPTVPRDLETICLKCLQKEPGRRYATAEELAEDLRRFRAGEPIWARPVGKGERIIRWCRRKPGVACLLVALVLVFLAGGAGVLWQWQRASRNAANFRRERDTAHQEKERAEHHLKMVVERVDKLRRLGVDLLRTPRQYRAGQKILEQALGFYQDMLPEDLNDPKVRKEAAELYRQVASIHRNLSQSDKAAEAFKEQAKLLSSLLAETPNDKDLHLRVADCYRYRGNELRDLGNVGDAREAYEQAVRLHKELARDFPGNADYQVALANTFQNLAGLLSRTPQAEDSVELYSRMLELYRSAVGAAPNNARYKGELAIGLAQWGSFLMDSGHTVEAESALQEAVEIYQKMLAAGHMKGYIEGYAASGFIIQGRVFAGTGRGQEAESKYREAVKLLERLVAQSPDTAYLKLELARASAGLADLLKASDRPKEGDEIFRRVVQIYDKLRADSPEVAAINNEVAWFLVATPELRLRDAALAVRLAEKAVSAQPKSSEYRNTLGVALYRNGNNQTAIAEIERGMSLRLGGDSLDWFFLAMAHHRLGDREKARMWFDRAVEWMDKNKPLDEELRRFRAEAEALLAEARQR